MSQDVSSGDDSSSDDVTPSRPTAAPSSPDGPALPWDYIHFLVSTALVEDLAGGTDVTSESVVSADSRASVRFVTRSDGVLCGLEFAAEACAIVDAGLTLTALRPDGSRLSAGDVFAALDGPTRSILTVERTALNFLAMLSGVATLTSHYVESVAGTRAVVVDTRKTLPGLRHAQKYAVTCGGGVNHRMGLYDAILIKDNHIAAAGGIQAAVAAARHGQGTNGAHDARDAARSIQVEVDDSTQLEVALASGVDSVLLDNFTPQQTAEAVELRNSRAPGVLLESSGGITLDTIRAYAEAGVDRISVGALTHSAPALDIGLDFATLV